MKEIVILLVLVSLVYGNSLSSQEVTNQVEFNIEIDNKPAGVIKIGLFGSVVPKTVANFVGICKGD